MTSYRWSWIDDVIRMRLFVDLMDTYFFNVLLRDKFYYNAQIYCAIEVLHLWQLVILWIVKPKSHSKTSKKYVSMRLTTHPNDVIKSTPSIRGHPV